VLELKIRQCLFQFGYTGVGNVSIAEVKPLQLRHVTRGGGIVSRAIRSRIAVIDRTDRPHAYVSVIDSIACQQSTV